MQKLCKKSFCLFKNLTLLILLLAGNLYSQSKSEISLFTESAGNSVLNTPELKKAVSKAVILNIDKAELQKLSESKPYQLILNMPFERNGANSRSAVKLNLTRYDILAPDAKIVTRTSRGNEEVTLNDLVVSYTGTIDGTENSFVTMNFSKDNVTGLISANDEIYNLGSVKDNAGNETDNYILYNEKDLKIKNEFSCSAEDDLSSEYTESVKNAIAKGLSDASPTDLYIAEIAVEIDFITYNIYNQNVTSAINYAMSIMAAASAIYMREVNVKLIVPYIRVWTTADPYTGTNSNTLLNQFRVEWTINQQAVSRTLAHLITRRSGGLGGIAWLNVLCDGLGGGNGYAFSNVTGSIVPLPTYSWDVMVVSHETGHNFGSNHTFNCSWPGGPIDTCYTVEGGCYNGPTIGIVGTIMSYCHLNGSISLTKGFGPLPKALIRSRAEAATCMNVSSRDLFIGVPNGGETFRTGDIVDIYWGTSLTGNVNIDFTTNNGTSWQTIQNNVPAAQRIYNWTIPNGPNILQNKIRILSSTNANTGDTSDLSFRILLKLNTITPVYPAMLTRVSLSPNSTEVQDFKWTSSGTEPSIRYNFKIKKLSTSTEYSYQSNNSGRDTVITFRKSFLDSLAGSFGTIGDSVRCSWKAVSYNGVDSAVSGNLIVTFVRTTVGINMISSIVPEKFSLENNYPNPFNPETNIKFNIPKATSVELKIYDSKGSEISTLVNEKLQSGSYQFNFNASGLPSGVYLYRLRTAEFSETKRMILLK